MKTSSRHLPLRFLLSSLSLLTFPSLLATPLQNLHQIFTENNEPIRYPTFITEFDGKLFFRANNLTLPVDQGKIFTPTFVLVDGVAEVQNIETSESVTSFFNATLLPR